MWRPNAKPTLTAIHVRLTAADDALESAQHLLRQLPKIEPAIAMELDHSRNWIRNTRLRLEKYKRKRGK